MRMRLRWAVTAVVIVLSAVTGCATSRGVMSLDVPKEGQVGSQKAGPGVFIRSVKDARVFEDNPRDPSIPSLKGGMSKNPEELRNRAIARKRNGYGKALGDIVLPEDRNVELIVRDLLRSSFAGLGYRIADDDKEPGTVVVDASVEKFWSWFTPGFWTISVEAEILTNVAIQKNGKADQAAIKGYAGIKGQAASTSSWKKVYRAAMDEYVEDAKKVLSPKLP